MRTFGPKPWGPSERGEVSHAPTPVGKKCFWCEEPIEENDYGLLIPHLSETGSHEQPYHDECQLRQIVGSVGHIMEKCSCFGGDTNKEGDPPGMTKRMAAKAAVQAFRKLKFPEKDNA